MSETKTYPIIEGLVGDEGENAGRIAVCAVLESSLDYPEQGLIIVGSPPNRHQNGQEGARKIYEPNLAQFAGSPDAIEKLANTLLAAVADVRAVRSR